MGRYDISVSNSGGGAGQTFDGLPAMLISDTLFVFDLNPTVVEKLKEFYSNHYIGMTTILQLERYKDDSLFEEGLKELINYAIFYNQDLCDKVFVLGTKDSHIEIANKLAASEQKAITKFRGRKWPDTESFSKLFLPISGCGSVSPSPEKMDMNNLVSWFFEIGYKEEMTTTEFPFDPETQELPIPLEPGVPMPPIPDPPSSGGGEEGGGEEGRHGTVIHGLGGLVFLVAAKIDRSAGFQQIHVICLFQRKPRLLKCFLSSDDRHHSDRRTEAFDFTVEQFTLRILIRHTADQTFQFGIHKFLYYRNTACTAP